ncbi:hypothetical protein [Caballeronia sp. LZ019]|nr:hypothetical protein [Caballeronia sp. LZ019]MDR5807836.1 hypothetical protein [Caballeronia sp. LZ019]
MFDIDTTLEQFSLLDDFSTDAPVWRPFSPAQAQEHLDAEEV